MDNVFQQEIINDLNNTLNNLIEIIKEMREDNVNIDEYCLENIEFNYPEEDKYGLIYIIDTLLDFSNLTKKKTISNVSKIIISFYKNEITYIQFLDMFKPEN